MVDVTAGTDTEAAPLFREVGATWYWLLAGPISAAIMLWIEKSNGNGWQISVPVFFLVVLTSFIALQVKAARIHTSVVLTTQTLRQGTETIRVSEIRQGVPRTRSSAGIEKGPGALAVRPRARRAGRGAQGPDRHRSAAHRRSHRPGVGAPTPASAQPADPFGRGARRAQRARRTADTTTTVQRW